MGKSPSGVLCVTNTGYIATFSFEVDDYFLSDKVSIRSKKC